MAPPLVARFPKYNPLSLSLHLFIATPHVSQPGPSGTQMDWPSLSRDDAHASGVGRKGAVVKGGQEERDRKGGGRGASPQASRSRLPRALRHGARPPSHPFTLHPPTHPPTPSPPLPPPREKLGGKGARRLASLSLSLSLSLLRSCSTQDFSPQKKTPTLVPLPLSPLPWMSKNMIRLCTMPHTHTHRQAGKQAGKAFSCPLPLFSCPSSTPLSPLCHQPPRVS
jgi:hypothetical protein